MAFAFYKDIVLYVYTVIPDGSAIPQRIDNEPPFPLTSENEGVGGNNALWQHLLKSVQGECSL